MRTYKRSEKTIAQVCDVYAEDLRRFVAEETGLDLEVPKVLKSQNGSAK